MPQKSTEHPRPSTVLCVLGMHRSGTSLVMRLLSLMGAHLGPPESLMPPTEDNPKGYWEHQELVHLNEAILNTLGGSWDEPPEFGRGWESSPELAPLRRKARTLVRNDFQDTPLWGWKDPRNCLTLPFWRKIVPNIRCLVCLRNPLDVTASLQRRDKFATTKCMDLWLYYTAACMETTSGLPRLFISYEDLFQDWWREVQRLARFIDVPLAGAPSLKKELRSVIEDELWHHRSTVIDVLDTPELTMPAKSLYFVLGSLVRAEQDRAKGHVGSAKFQQSLDVLARYAAEERRRLLRLEAENVMLGVQLREKGDQLAEKERALADKERALAHRKRAVAKKDALLAETEAMMREAKAEAGAAYRKMDEVTNATGYRLLERVRRPIRWLAPEGTLRRVPLVAVTRGLNIILTQGLWTFLRRAVQVWRWLPHLHETRTAPYRLSLDGQYQQWLRIHSLTQAQARRMRERAARLTYRPKIAIIVPVYNTDLAWLRAAIDSVRAQLYDNWELCIANDGSTRPGVRELLDRYAVEDPRIKVTHSDENRGISAASDAALATATGEFIGLLDHDDELKPEALLEVVKLLNERPDLDFIYSDEDKRDLDGRLVEPFFKPDWSPDLLMSVNYVTHFSVFRKEIAETLGAFRNGYDGSQDYDLVLRVTERTDRIAHIAEPLYTWRKAPGSAAASVEAKDYAYRAAKRALQDSLSRRGVEGEVLDGAFKGWYRVKYRIQGHPRVTIIVPTKDRVEMLRRCIKSIERKTTYDNYDILVIDNNSEKPETLEYLDRLRWPVIRHQRLFNFAEIVNLGARQADSEFLLFLNNDIEVITPEWIEAMLEHGQRPEVAAVGARLLYPDGRVQHEGIIIGLGGGSAGNVDHGGYFALGQSIRNCSAVTAACMLTRPSVFWELDGFDERLRVAFNDVDYCLRARQKGYLIVYTPFAALYHYESASRGSLHPEEDEKFFRTRWGKPGEYRDPYYNENLDLGHPFTIRL